MEKIQSVMSRLLREEDGAAAAEYAILVAAVAAAVSVAVTKFNLSGIFTSVSTKVSTLIG